MTLFEERMLEVVLVDVDTCLVEVVHVQLPHEGGEVLVLEVLGQDFLRELIWSVHDETLSILTP